MSFRLNRFVFPVAAAVLLSACRQAPPELMVRSEASPMVEQSVVPQLTPLAGDRILASWQRPLASGGYAFEMAIKDGSRWSDVRTIAQGPKVSMFSADIPAVATLDGKKLLAYWEVTEEGYNATTIQTALSSDEGRTWVPASTPYEKALPGQHSFISWFPTTGGIGLTWLDASVRSQVHAERPVPDQHAKHDVGSVGLRYATLNADGVAAHNQFIDPIACECCPTSAAITGRGPVVVYRDRQELPGTTPSDVQTFRPTVRDIYIVRHENGAWKEPRRVHEDNWVINACPDNGPAVDASANAVAVAWWTGSGDQPKVQVSFSSDAGDSFGSAIRVDAGAAEGQVTVALLSGGRSAVVGWLENGQTWARFVSDAGVMSAPTSLGSAPRHSRLPRWIVNPDGTVTVAWTSKKDGMSRVEMARIEVARAR